MNELKKNLSPFTDLVSHRGPPLKPLRMLIMGVSNLGKSALMNTILKKELLKSEMNQQLQNNNSAIKLLIV